VVQHGVLQRRITHIPTAAKNRDIECYALARVCPWSASSRTTSEKGRHQYPESVAGTILYLKQLYPDIHYREIARIVQRKFGYKTNHHTIKAFLERHPIPVQLPLPVTHFHQFEDAY